MDGKREKVPVEEEEVEREAHAEGVDAGAAGDEKADTCLLAFQMGEPEQAGAKPRGNGNLQAEHRRDREVAQPNSRKKVRHGPTSLNSKEFSPPPRADFAFLPYMAPEKAKSAENEGVGTSLWG